jgi:hypothetical protein
MSPFNLTGTVAITTGAFRMIDGTARSSHTQAMTEQIFPLAESAWRFVKKAGA